MMAHVLASLTAMVVAGGAVPQAQEPSWLGWHGCWKAVGEATSSGETLCIVSGSAADEVRLVSVENGAVVATTPLRANGVARSLEEGGCTGTETARWSRNARRVFLRAELDCAGVRRVATAVMAMVAENEWVSIEAVKVGGEESSRTVRYQAVSTTGMPTEIAAALEDGRHLLRQTARMQNAAPLDLDEVIEATSAISPSAVEALIAARKSGFGLNAEKLARLEQAGVPSSVIDVMVAVSYPGRWEVRAASPTRQTGVGVATDQSYCSDATRRPYLSYSECLRLLNEIAWGCPTSFGSRYGMGMGFTRYGYSASCYGQDYGYSRYGYSPFGYSRFYAGNDYYSGRPIIIIDTEDRQVGELKKGGGYSTGGTTTRTAQPRSSTTSSGTSTGSTSSGGSSTTSSGTSTTSGTSAPPRTAIPRPPGGGS